MEWLGSPRATINCRVVCRAWRIQVPLFTFLFQGMSLIIKPAWDLLSLQSQSRKGPSPTASKVLDDGMLSQQGQKTEKGFIFQLSLFSGSQYICHTPMITLTFNMKWSYCCTFPVSQVQLFLGGKQSFFWGRGNWRIMEYWWTFIYKYSGGAQQGRKQHMHSPKAADLLPHASSPGRDLIQQASSVLSLSLIQSKSCKLLILHT